MFFNHIKENLIINDPLQKNEEGELLYKIGAVFFPEDSEGMIVSGPGVHAIQKMAFLEICDDLAERSNKPLLTDDQRDALLQNSVDLIMRNDTVYIRPDTDRMDLAFKADDLLQKNGIPKYNIKFLKVINEKVRAAIKQKGQLWRITSLPRTREQIKSLIEHSLVAISKREMYYYNMSSGTRYLTFHEFSKLGDLQDEDLKECLSEIQKFSRRKNKYGSPEVAFFMSKALLTDGRLFEVNFTCMSNRELRKIFAELKNIFQCSVSPQYQFDDFEFPEWTNAMLSVLIEDNTAEIVEEKLLGLCPELYYRVKWLPGAEINADVIEYDYLFCLLNDNQSNLLENNLEGDLPECDDKVKCFIENFVREYSNVEYINIGRIVDSLSRRISMDGRRDVYIALIKTRDQSEDIIRIIRFQKRDVPEFLDEGYTMVNALKASQLYTRNIFDRYMACRELCMSLSPFWLGRVGIIYDGKNPEYRNERIELTYYERDYVFGTATDKITPTNYGDSIYVEKFARLLGEAAAVNMIIGRVYRSGILFDDGDEILITSPDGLPAKIINSDHTGSFTDCDTPLSFFARDYAEPVKRRAIYIVNYNDFARIYTEALCEKFEFIQQKVFLRHEFYESLFNDYPFDENDFRNRWLLVLKRLQTTNARQLSEDILQRCML